MKKTLTYCVLALCGITCWMNCTTPIGIENIYMTMASLLGIELVKW